MKKLFLPVLLAVFLSGCAISKPVISGKRAAQTSSSAAMYEGKVSSESESGNIKVSRPKPFEVIGTSLHIEGEARVFENVVNVEVFDAAGKKLAEGHTEAKSPDVGQFGPFTADVDLSKIPTAKLSGQATPSGEVKIFNFSAKDGSDENVVMIPLKFK